MAKVAAETGHAGLAEAARRHAHAQGRKDFIGAHHLALDARGRVCAPHHQCVLDLRAIELALRLLGGEPDVVTRHSAARSLRRVGSNHLFPYLGHPAFRRHLERLMPAALNRSWAAASQLTESADVWPEIAGLLGEPGARPFGGWVTENLLKAHASTTEELRRRLDAMARSVLDHDDARRGSDDSERHPDIEGPGR
jgi:hypothetical protein